jgi:hypothetical protein
MKPAAKLWSDLRQTESFLASIKGLSKTYLSLFLKRPLKAHMLHHRQ